VRTVLFSHDGRRLFTAGDDESVRVWNTKTGSLEFMVDSLAGVRVIAISPDDQTLAVGLQDSSVQLLDASDGALLKTLTGHEDWVRSLAFSPDGRTLASGAFDATARLWDVETGRLRYTLSDHQSSVLGLAFSPDGARLATGSVDTTVKLWDVSGGGLLRTLVGHTDFVYGIAFSPDGKLLASSAGDNTARVWELSSPEINPVPQPSTPGDCRSCHHPRGTAAPPRVIQVSCEACHAGGISLNWCPFFPRTSRVDMETTYSPPAAPVGLPVSSGNLAVQINYPTNGETLYSNSNNLAPVFVTGRVFYPGDRSDIHVRMEIRSAGQPADELVTQIGRDGSFAFSLAVNPQGAPIVAGAKAADPDCAVCHEDFKSQATFPNGRVHILITAVSPEGEQAVDERWITVDTSERAEADIQVLDQETHAPLPGLPIRATAILYEWRERYSSDVSDDEGRVHLSLEALSQAATEYSLSVPPTSLNGFLYESVSPVIINLPPGAAYHEPVTVYATVSSGQIAGTLTGREQSEPMEIWAVHLPDGSSYKSFSTGREFHFEEVPSGSYLVFVDPRIAKTGYRTESVPVDLTKKALASVELELEKISAAAISGRISDEDGYHLPFGWITAGSAQTIQPDLLTGRFHLSGLPEDKLTVIAHVPGYYSQAGVIEPSVASEKTLDFSLVPRPETLLIPWGQARIVLPPETVYEQGEDTLTLYNGWVWGENLSGAPFNIRLGDLAIKISEGSFALEALPSLEGWLYLMDGEALIRTPEGLEIPVSGTQMTALSNSLTPKPIPYEEIIFSTFHSNPESPLQNKWEPTLQAQIRDRLAQIGINVAQFVTFVTYALVMIVIVASLIGGIYSTWKRIKPKHG
jgi:hypothetical protein